MIAKIEKRKALSVAEKVRTWFNQLFRYALVIVPGLEQNPASDLDVVAMPLPPVNHNPFLRMADLPKLLQRLRKYRGRLQTQLGLRLLLLTGVRTGALRLATPDQFDLDRGLWIIPPDVVKQLQVDMRKKRQLPKDIPPYIVPLSVQAIEIVRHLLEHFKPAQHYQSSRPVDLQVIRLGSRFRSSLTHFMPRSRSALPTTEAELRLIANAAISGDSSQPVSGYSTPAATGMPRPL